MFLKFDDWFIINSFNNNLIIVKKGTNMVPFLNKTINARGNYAT
jgi:hypothetical protein